MMLQHPTSGAVDALTEAARAHVAESLHLKVEVAAWSGASALPRYLTAAYMPVHACVGSARMVWLLAKEPVTPGILRKHMARIRESWDGEIALIIADLAAKQRQRFVAAGIPFVVPGQHVYLPGLGADMRERTRKAPQPRERLRPAAQAVLVWLLLDGPGEHTTNDLVDQLGYERMTLSRSIGELEAAGAILPGKTRRPKSFRLAGEPPVVWTAMLPRLKNPVARSVSVSEGGRFLADAPLAGHSALAEYSDIAAPSAETRAISNRAFGELELTVTEDDEDRALSLERWTYDPRALSSAETVDPLSLYLTLRDDPDERVQKALARMLKGVWR